MLADSYAHCQALVHEADKERFLASLFAPAQLRPHLFAVYAFNIEIARTRAVAREALPGEVRLQWWRDALTGIRPGEAAAHPVAGALLDTLERRHVFVQPLVELIEARRFDLYGEPMATIAEFDSYARKTSSGLIATAAGILGAGDDVVVIEAADAAGMALAQCVLLNVVGAHAARRQLYLPREMLDRYGVRAEDIFAGQAGEPSAAMLAELRARVRGHFLQFLERAGALPATALPAFLPVTLVPQLLGRMERRGYDPFETIEVAQWRRQLALLRTAWLGFPAR